MHLFTRAVIARSHQLGDFVALSSGVQQSKVSVLAGLAPPGCVRANLLPGSSLTAGDVPAMLCVPSS